VLLAGAGFAEIEIEPVPILNTRYEKPKEILTSIASAKPGDATKLVQELYKEPTKERLIAQRVQETPVFGDGETGRRVAGELQEGQRPRFGPDGVDAR